MYQSLNPGLGEIRLLVLFPGPEDSQIEGTIYVSTLDSAHSRWHSRTKPELVDDVEATRARNWEPQKNDNSNTTHYEALSYEWGDPKAPKHNIVLNGQPFEVRENVFQALLCLRSMEITGPLWVDAICINQEDVQERNHQVRIMDSIYRLARRVRVWIGCDTKEISGAFQLIPEIMIAYSEEEAKEVEKRGQSHRFWPNSVSYSDENPPKSSSDEYITPNWEDLFSSQDKMDIWDLDYMKSTLAHKEWWGALVRFLERSYWTRIWVVQEYLLAQDITIHCGCETVDGRDLDMAFNSILQFKVEEHVQYPSYFKEIIKSIDNSVGKRIIQRRRDGGKQTLADLIEATKSSKCHDPHDRIYAIIALANDMWDAYDSISTDYDRSIFKVKMDVAWFIHQRSRFDRAYVTRVCSLLDEIFTDCPGSY